jgi:hypothetical protein
MLGLPPSGRDGPPAKQGRRKGNAHSGNGHASNEHVRNGESE